MLRMATDKAFQNEEEVERDKGEGGDEWGYSSWLISKEYYEGYQHHRQSPGRGKRSEEKDEIVSFKTADGRDEMRVPAYHVERMFQVEHLLKETLLHRWNSADSPTSPWTSRDVIKEIWKSPALNSFVFADFADPWTVRPRHRTAMDVVVRSISVLPMVVHLPWNLRKESIARALCQDYLSSISGQQHHHNNNSSFKTKSELLSYILRLMKAWDLAQRCFVNVSPVLAQFIGPLPANPVGNINAEWSGFSQVFVQFDFYRDMLDVIKDPRRIVRFATRRAEEDTQKEWSSLVITNDLMIEDGWLKQLVSLAATTAEDKDELLWKTYRFALGMEFHRTVEICKDWLKGGVRRRVEMLMDRARGISDDAQVQVLRPESTQRLVLLFLTGGYKYVRRDKSLGHQNNNNYRGDHHHQQQPQDNDDEAAFVDSLFKKRILVAT